MDNHIWVWLSGSVNYFALLNIELIEYNHKMGLFCNCGFYAKENIKGMCSQCYKKYMMNKKNSNCGLCDKKIELTLIVCRCEQAFYTLHWYSNEHKCTFHYQAVGCNNIEKENPKIQKNKFSLHF